MCMHSHIYHTIEKINDNLCLPQKGSTLDIQGQHTRKEHFDFYPRNFCKTTQNADLFCALLQQLQMEYLTHGLLLRAFSTAYSLNVLHEVFLEIQRSEED